MAEVGSAFVSVVPSAKGFGKKLDSEIGPDLDKSGKSSGKRLGSSMGGSFGRTFKAALSPALAVLGTAGLIAGVKDAIGEAREAQKVGALTNNVIKTTGGVANVTAKQVGQLSTAISNKTGIDDEQIQSASNLLLTFKNVRNEVGKGANIFDRATAAAADLSASGFGDLSGASKQLGKALNDPVKGISALGRAGVTFTDVQKEQIKGFVKSNDLLSAQKIILKEVESQVGGAAAATATSGEKARVAFGNLQETIGTALLPAVDNFSDALTEDVIPAVSSFVTGMQDGTGAGGEVADTLGDIYSAAKPIAVTIGRIVSAFADLPGGTQKVILLAGAALLLKNRFGDSIPTLQSFSKEGTIAAAKTVAIRGGSIAAAGGLAALAQKAGGASTGLGTLATVGSGLAAGFAVGGPWGAAIGGAVSVLAVFSSQSASAAAAQDLLDSAGKRVADTLNQQTGALTANSRAVAAKELADSGALAAAKAMKIPLADVLSASLGNAAAIKSVTAASEAWANAQAKNGTYTEKQEGQLVDLRNAIGATSRSIADQRKKILQVNEAMTGLDGKKATVKVTANTTGFFNGIQNVFASLDKAIAKASRVKVGKNAKGTDNWRGGLTWVGEEGPELINLAKGAQVIPNHKISAGVTGSSITSPAGVSDSMQIVDGSQIIGYLRGIATGQARIEIGAYDRGGEAGMRFAT